MLNLLVANNNIHYAKSLINYILLQHQSIKLVNICTNGMEVLEILSKVTVDVLILDLKMPYLNESQVLNKILEKNLPIVPYILIISDVPELLKKTNNNLIFSYSTNKLSSMEIISDNIGKIIQEIELKRNSPKVKEKIFKELKKLRFNFKHIGSTYIMEAILIICNSYNINLIDNLEQYVYKKIAQKHAKSIKNIKSNIYKATDTMYLECEQSYINSYFNFSYNNKPTPKMIINTILTKIISSTDFM